jgi:ubiquinone/menaquinone biosynthesis C-methylase UbiE
MENDGNLFNALAERYDLWYDTAFGVAAFQQEIACLRLVCTDYSGAWLEVGVGSGRFARELGIACGLDPAPEMLRLAVARGIEAHQGSAEAMPFPNASFAGVLLAFTLCFLAKPSKALQECRRILRPGGSLLLGFVPAGGSWGRHYARKAAAGHPLYSKAVFYSAAEVLELAVRAGFSLKAAASALFSSPELQPEPDAGAIPGCHEEAGFMALRLCLLSPAAQVGLAE